MSFTHFDRCNSSVKSPWYSPPPKYVKELTLVFDIYENILNPILWAKWSFCLTIDRSVIMSIVR
jgi:hypothetical protein